MQAILFPAGAPRLNFACAKLAFNEIACPER